MARLFGLTGSGLFVGPPAFRQLGRGVNCTGGESSLINTVLLASWGNTLSDFAPGCTAF
jgi:hypothetical protein